MATEKYFRVRCNTCWEGSEMVESCDMTQAELRADLKKRFGWISYRTGNERVDVCPSCQTKAAKGIL